MSIWSGLFRNWRPMLALAVVALTAGVMAPPAAAQLTDEQQANFRVWQATLDDGRDPLNRKIAARRLLEMDSDESIEFLVSRISDRAFPDRIGAIAAALRELESTPPNELLEPILVSLLNSDNALRATYADALSAFGAPAVERLTAILNVESTTEAERLALLATLQRFPSPDAVNELIAWLDVERPAPLREQAHLSLVEMTGKTNLGASVEAWSTWWNQQAPNGRERLLRLYANRLESRLASQTQALDVMRRERDSLESELTAALEQQYALTDASNRSALLARLLQSPRASTRQLGLSLVERAIVNAESIDQSVANAVAKLLDDPNRPIRRSAIRMLGLIDGRRLAERAVARLSVESDQELRNLLFHALTSNPMPEAAPALVDAIARPADREAALTGLVALARDEALPDSHLTSACEAIMRARAEALDAAWTPAELELLAMSTSPDMYGEAERAIARDSGVSDAARRAAAAGLARSGQARESLIAASADPIVYPFAAAAVSVEAGIDALETLIALPAPTTAAQREAIDRLMLRMPAQDWLDSDLLLESIESVDRLDRIRWLSRTLELTSTNAGNGVNGVGHGDPTITDAHMRRALCRRLAELHLATGNPERALAALQAAPKSNGDAALFHELESIANVALARFDEIAEGGTLELWLRGAEVAASGQPLDRNRLQTILNQIEQRFPIDEASEALRQRLYTLRDLVSGVTGDEETPEAPVASVEDDPTSTDEPENDGGGG